MKMRALKYSIPLVMVVIAAVILAIDGLVRLALSTGEIINAFLVALFVSVTWFYADETAAMRTAAAEQVRLGLQTQKMARARISVRPVPARPTARREFAGTDLHIDPLTLGVEIVSSGGSPAHELDLRILFYQTGLSRTSGDRTEHDAERPPQPVPRLSVLLPGESRTFWAPRTWKDFHYRAARFSVRVTGTYHDGIETVSLDETVDISAYLVAAADTRMLEMSDPH